jgi:hypothetical protein
MRGGVAQQRIAFRLPIEEWPRAVVQSDFGWRGARVLVNERVAVEAGSRELLEAGVGGRVPGSVHRLELRLVGPREAPEPELRVDGRTAPREDRLRAPPSHAAWIHAVQALCASVFGFLASWFYLKKGDVLSDVWAHKMGIHTLGWHLLLVVTLFPASVWGQRTGIRGVQLVSALFFFIHVGIATANGADVSSALDIYIALFNALSGALFLIAVWYGQRAFRSMDPLAALRAGRASVG